MLEHTIWFLGVSVHFLYCTKPPVYMLVDRPKWLQVTHIGAKLHGNMAKGDCDRAMQPTASTITVTKQCNRVADFGLKTKWGRLPAGICFLCICLQFWICIHILKKQNSTLYRRHGCPNTSTHCGSVRRACRSHSEVPVGTRPDPRQSPDGLTAVCRSCSASRGRIGRISPSHPSCFYLDRRYVLPKKGRRRGVHRWTTPSQEQRGRHFVPVCKNMRDQMSTSIRYAYEYVFDTFSLRLDSDQEK